MATRKQLLYRITRLYKEQTGKTEVDYSEVAKFAHEKMKLKLPTPPSPLALLTKEFTQTAREELRHDPQTGEPYRANHHILVRQGSTQLHLWIDIDEATRKNMIKSLYFRREQMIGDGLQLTYDKDHWNRVHPDEQPIDIIMDFTEDIQERKNAPDERKKAV
ncbi:MAG: hypothetical protein ABSE08_12550 [Syntrophobacteraceae bacterium]